MNVQGFFLAHGEKLLVALVVVICAVSLYGTMTNPETESETTLAEINEIVAKLDRAYQNPGRPNLAQTRDFEDEIKARFQLQVGAQPVIAHIAGPEDVSAGEKAGTRQAYAYEIAVPDLTVTDTIGSFEIAVELDEGSRPDAADEYLRDSIDGTTWVRQEPEGDVVNAAKPIGVLVEYRIFQDKMGINEGWQPIESDEAPGGILPLVNGRGTAVVREIKPWQTYDLRARTLIAATGTTSPEEADYTIGSEVLPVVRPLPLQAPPRNWAQAKEQLQQPFMNGEFDKLLAERYQGPLPQGARSTPLPGTGSRGSARPGTPGMPPMEGMPAAGGGNQPMVAAAGRVEWEFFLGAPTRPLVSLVSKSQIYLGLKRASGGLQGIEPSATLIVKRLVKDEDGTTLGWTPAVEYKLEAGQEVGKEEQLKAEWEGGRILFFDLSTPFAVEGIENGIERVLYYELKLGSAPNAEGRFEKRLEVEPKTTRTDAVILKNTLDETTLRLLKFERIREPFANRWSYPAIPPGGIDEEEIFKQAPLAWQNPELTPPRPIVHEDKELLNKLLDVREARLVEPPYVEMPDGRVYYYYPPEKEVYLKVIPGSEWDRHGGPKARMAPEPPGGGNQPKPPAEGGMPPEEGMPPEMDPDAFIPPEGFDEAPDEGRRRRR